MAKLILFYDDLPVKEIVLDADHMTIGRNTLNHISLDQSVISGKHAVILHKDNEWIVEDLGSTNGTFVNKKQIIREPLKSGDRIEIGDYVLIFDTEGKEAFNYSASEFTINMEKEAARDLAGLGDYQAHRPTDYFEQSDDSPPDKLQLLMRYIPVLQWGMNYRKNLLRGDITAGITVAIMLIPQGMAYALLAGLPPIYGLYASIAPPLIYALLGTSRQLSVGPVALDSLLVAAGVGLMAHSGSGHYITLVILLAFMVGAIQILMGLARLGFVVNFLSYPVMTGFTSAAALIIAFSQLKHLLGVSLPQTHMIHQTIYATLTHLTAINPYTLLIGAASIASMWGLKKWNKRFPGPLVVVVVSTVLVWLFSLHEKGVQIVATVPSGVPAPSLPVFTWDTFSSLLPLAATIALVGFMQAISVAKFYASRNGYRVNANQELFALGAANLAGSLFKGYPISGGLSRSAVNAQAGANTGLASIITSLLIFLTLLILTPLFYYLPKAVLAAIIMSAVGGLIDTHEMRYLFQVKKSEGALLVLTMVATLTLGITQGLFLGMVASILLFITLNTRPNMAVLGRLPGTDIFRNTAQFPEAEAIEGLLILRIDASFYFANAEFLKEKLTAVAECDHPPRAVILDGSSINDFDSSADTTFHEIVADFKRRNIDLYIAGVKHPVREVMQRSGLYEKVGAEYFFFTIEAAVKRFQSRSQATGVYKDR